MPFVEAQQSQMLMPRCERLVSTGRRTSLDTTRHRKSLLFARLRSPDFLALRSGRAALWGSDEAVASTNRRRTPSIEARHQKDLETRELVSLLFALRNSFRAKPINAEEITTSAETAET